MKNVLSYSIAREWLDGFIGTEHFSMCAWAGGRRGTKSDDAEHNAASYNVFRRTDHDGGAHGGPVPPGLYICRYTPHHEEFGECIFLDQTATALFEIDAGQVRAHGRDAFYIHGRGPHGSDGCIVPENEAERQRLNKAVKQSADSVLLRVSELGMPLPAVREGGTSIG